MGKAVLISIQPKWCEKIVNGEKTIEVRKSRPKLKTPFKCYIYCTYGQGLIERYDADYPNMLLDQKVSKEKIWGNCCNGKVIGEFVCSGFDEFIPSAYGYKFRRFRALYETCLSVGELRDYLNGQPGYGWQISDLLIYDKPKLLSEFKPWSRECLYSDLGFAIPNCENCHDCKVKRPPQSWCYVEGLLGGADHE